MRFVVRASGLCYMMHPSLVTKSPTMCLNFFHHIIKAPTQAWIQRIQAKTQNPRFRGFGTALNPSTRKDSSEPCHRHPGVLAAPIASWRSRVWGQRLLELRGFRVVKCGLECSDDDLRVVSILIGAEKNLDHLQASLKMNALLNVGNDVAKGLSQRVHVGIWYILRAQRGSHIPTLRAKYIPYSYMDPLGIGTNKSGAPPQFLSQPQRENSWCCAYLVHGIGAI